LQVLSCFHLALLELPDLFLLVWCKLTHVWLVILLIFIIVIIIFPIIVFVNRVIFFNYGSFLRHRTCWWRLVFLLGIGVLNDACFARFLLSGRIKKVVYCGLGNLGFFL